MSENQSESQPGSQKQEAVDISVIIPARNEGKRIGFCLEAIYSQETTFSYEIIVIDSGSTDNTLDVVRQYPAIRLSRILPEQFGHGKTRNLGAQKALGRYLVFLNADAIPCDSQWLNALIEPFEKDNSRSHLAGVFSRHIPAPNCHLYMARDLLESMPDTPILRTHAGKFDFMLFSTVSAAVPRSVWETYPFDNEIQIAEDQQWARDVLADGLSILYHPGSVVRHSHNYSPRHLMESKRRIARASKKFSNPLSALVVGFVLICGGIFVKITKDLIFILFQKSSRVPFTRKLFEIKTSIVARFAGFWGKYTGWLEFRHE